MACVVVAVASRTGSGQGGSIPGAGELEGLSYPGSVYERGSGQAL